MNFNVKEWRRVYDEVKYLGEIYKDSLPIFIFKNYKWDKHPPKTPLSLDAQRGVEREIKKLIAKTSRYMDMCGITARMPKRKKLDG